MKKSVRLHGRAISEQRYFSHVQLSGFSSTTNTQISRDFFFYVNYLNKFCVIFKDCVFFNLKAIHWKEGFRGEKDFFRA